MNPWIAVVGITPLMISGCGGPQHVPGGTRGIVHVGATPLADIQVHVHRVEEGMPQRLGFGVSRPDGTFECVQTGGTGPLWLGPGEYCFTVESVGPVALRFPAKFGDPSNTPLQRTWSASEEELDLELPQPVP